MAAAAVPPGWDGRVIVKGAVSWGATEGLRSRRCPLLCRLLGDPFFCEWKREENFQFRATISSLKRRMQPRFGIPTLLWGESGSAVGAYAYAGEDGGWIQVERGARPLRQSCLSKKEMPTSEVNRRTMSVSAGFAHALEHTGGYTPAEAKRVAGRCSRMSCLMTLRARRHSRQRPDTHDDAFDWFMRVLTNGRVSGIA